MSVSRRLNWGMSIQALDAMNIYSIESKDLKGYPFVTITVTAPIQAKDFWELAATVKGDEWNPADETSDWTTTLTGATTIRDPLIVSNVGLSLPVKMYKTVEVMGGFENFKEVVAVDLQNFVLRDTQDRLWNIDEQKLLTPEQFKTVTDMYNEILKANNTPEVATQMKEEWQEFLAGETPETELNATSYTHAHANLTASGVDLDDFATESGSLDPRKLKNYMEAQAASSNTQGDLQPSYVNPDQWVGLFRNQRLRTGTLPIANNATHTGYSQYPSQYGRSGQFDFISCVTNQRVKSDVIGCAPAAFTGLIQWYATKKGYTFFGTTDSSTIAYNLSVPVGMFSRPLIAEYMLSCSTGASGVLTVGGNFANGANRFLYDQRSPLKMVSNVSHYAGNTWSAPAKADILIKHIGTDRPVIAEYFRGFTNGHFSPVVDYAVYGNGSSGLNIRTVDDLQYEKVYTWYSLSGTWGTERGVFALELK